MERLNRRMIAVIGLILLIPLTLLAFWNDGLGGFGEAILFNWASLQIFVDLVIALGLVMIWIWQDAHKAGRNPWPWIAATFIVGSFSPLVYLLIHRADEAG